MKEESNQIGGSPARPLIGATAAGGNAKAACVIDLETYRKNRDGYERVHRIVPLKKSSVQIELDLGDAILTWQLNRQQANELIKLLRKASHLRQDGEIRQEFLRHHCRR